MSVVLVPRPDSVWERGVYCSPEHTDSTAAVLRYGTKTRRSTDASTEDFGIADARA